MQPTGYVVDYEQLTEDIVDAAPAGTTKDMSDYPNTVTINFPNGSTHPGAPSFILDIRHPY